MVALAVVWGIVLLASQSDHRVSPDLISAPPTGLPVIFRLLDSQGRPVSAESYRGRWMLLYFGYAFCPDICPTVLQSIGTTLDDLGPAAAKVAALFITIDPARDTPAALAQYVRLFDDRLIGLTGDLPEIVKLEDLLQVRVSPAAAGRSGDYSIQHSSSIYLVSPSGRLDTVFPAGTSSELLQASIAARMAEAGRGG